MATRFYAHPRDDQRKMIKDFATYNETKNFVDKYNENKKPRQRLAISECDFDEVDECFDMPLNDNEFTTLVDLMQDHNMEFELEPATNPNGHVVLKFNDGHQFRCLAREFDRAVDYISNPSLE